MSGHHFNMQLQCSYKGSNNAIAGIDVTHKVGEKWEALNLNLVSPGFDIFIYAMLTCQHMYFRVNCAERGLVLETARGNITIDTDQDRTIETLRIHFSGILASGKVSQDDIDRIVSRMEQCPVSCNLRTFPDASTTISLK